MSINKVIIIGRVGKAPEVRTLQSGTKVAKFSVATSEKYTNKQTGEAKEATEWHNITCWGNLADIAEKYIKKGDQIYIEGSIHHSEHEGKYYTDIRADKVRLLGKKDNSNTASKSDNPSKPITKVDDLPDDEKLPWE